MTTNKEPETHVMTPKKLRFIEEYCVDLNGTQAAIRAGYSKDRARITASELLAERNISAEIQKRLERLTKAADIKTEQILEEVSRVAFVDPREVMPSDSYLGKQLRQMPEDIARAIASIELITRKVAESDDIEYVAKIKFWNKLDALEKLGKYKKLWDGDSQANTNISIIIDNDDANL